MKGALTEVRTGILEKVGMVLQRRESGCRGAQWSIVAVDDFTRTGWGRCQIWARNTLETNKISRA